MAQRATIENFAQATEIVKELGLGACDGWQGNEWKEQGLKAFRRAIEDTMEPHLEKHRLELVESGLPDRRNGYYERRILIHSENELPWAKAQGFYTHSKAICFRFAS